jgi:N,N'-diacetyllegionaminate synthase
MPGPDHKASSTPEEFKDYVKNIRKAELMLGSHLKKCQLEERQMASVSRKSIVLSKNVDVGSILAIDDLQLQRPGNGISPCHLNSLVGLRVRQGLERGQQLKWTDLVDGQL